MGRTGLENSDRDRVRDASDIVRVVGEHVRLRPRAREYIGLCPFHDDHNPSMTVIPSKQIFHCFVCGKGGDVFTFVQEFHRMEFREALEFLAERAGIALTRRAASAESGPTRKSLHEANAFALGFFRAILRHPDHGAAARDVVERRRINAEMAERFAIGASPDRWDGLLLKARAAGVDESLLLEAGLLKKRESGEGCYDALRNRLIFPIHDLSGRIIGFGGRKINEEDEPKYLNSPETRIFDKSSTLYGLYQATRALQQARTAIITEGYTDVIACHQAGFENAVATLGTALTRGHAQILRRTCDRVILLFDSDDAGQRAADRAAEIFFAEPLDVAVCTLGAFTDAKDPDELLKRDDGREVFQRALDGAIDLLTFRYRRLKAMAQGLGPASLQRLLEEELSKLSQLGLSTAAPVRRAFIMNELSRITGLSPDVLARAIPAGRRAPARVADAQTADASPRLPRAHELKSADWLVACALCDASYWPMLADEDHDALSAEAYSSALIQSIAFSLNHLALEGRPTELNALLAELESPEASGAAVHLHQIAQASTDGNAERMRTLWNDCLANLRREHLRRADAAANDLASRLDARRHLHATHGSNPRALPRPRTPGG